MPIHRPRAAPARPRLALHRPAEVPAAPDVRSWRVNGHLAQVQLYTADPPPDAQPFGCGVWAALRIP